MEKEIEYYPELKQELKKLIDNVFNIRIHYDPRSMDADAKGYFFYYHKVPHQVLKHLEGYKIPFSYTLTPAYFKLQIGSAEMHRCKGDKLAVLSFFYSVLKHKLGEPVLYVDNMEDNEEIVTIYWSFIKRKEFIQFAQEKLTTENIIILDDTKLKSHYKITDIKQQKIDFYIGLPLSIIPLVREHLKDFQNFRHGKKLDKVLTTEENKEEISTRTLKNKHHHFMK